MVQISPFWSGATSVARRVCLVDVASRVGGWEQLPRALAAGDIRCGLSASQRNMWLNAEGYETTGHVVRCSDNGFPRRLLECGRPPALLHVEGQISSVHHPTVAIVGSRAATLRGVSQAWLLGWAFANAGWTVVSGLAVGVDAAAHRGALTAGRTVAVLGHGLSHMYPRRHHWLRQAIATSGGAVLTSFKDEMRPAVWTFPERNRWIAGLADVVVIVEAKAQSGALWTARHASSMQREVVVVSQNRQLSNGCKALADRGADVVHDVWRWCGQRGVAPRSPPEPWLRDVLAGDTVDTVCRIHRLPVPQVSEQLARLCASGEVESLSYGRYGPRGRWAV